MSRRIALILVIVTLLANGSAFGQAKVGLSGAQFLSTPTSARLAGMGGAGAALYDNQGWLYNPAMAGLAALEQRVVFLPRAWVEMPVIHRFTSFGAAAPLSGFGVARPRFAWAIAYSQHEMVSNEIDETDYVGIPTGRIFQWKDLARQITGAFAVRGRFEFALGAGVKYVRQEVHDYDADGAAFEVGMLLRRPLHFKPIHGEYHLTPSLGIVYANFGPDLNMIRDDYPLPAEWRIGLGCEAAYERFEHFGGWNWYALAVSIEAGHIRNQDWVSRQGVEATFFEAAAIRVGHRGTSGSSDGISTWGFGLHLAGITKTLVARFGNPDSPGSVAGFLIERANITYSYASVEVLVGDPIPYHEFVLALNL